MHPDEQYGDAFDGERNLPSPPPTPRLEWKRLSGDNDDRDIRREARADDCYLHLWTNAYFGVLTVRIYGSGHPRLEFYDRVNRLPDEGEATFADRCERIAELVVARNRALLAEIAGVK